MHMHTPLCVEADESMGFTEDGASDISGNPDCRIGTQVLTVVLMIVRQILLTAQPSLQAPMTAF